MQSNRKKSKISKITFIVFSAILLSPILYGVVLRVIEGISERESGAAERRIFSRWKSTDAYHYPNLAKLKVHQEMEKGVDFEAANREQDQLLDELAINQPSASEEIEQLSKEYARTNEGTALRAYYARVREVANLSAYPALTAYLQYLNVYDEISQPDLEKEIEEYSRKEFKKSSVI